MKGLHIKTAHIEVSTNSRIASGYYFDLKAYGVLPGCRKAQLLTFTPMARSIWVKALFSYNGSASVHPEAFSEWIDTLPVVADRVLSPELVITPELREMARADWRDLATCPAVKDAEIHPSYKPTYDCLHYTEMR